LAGYDEMRLRKTPSIVGLLQIIFVKELQQMPFRLLSYCSKNNLSPENNFN
jgi:hypothetical protein